MDKFRKIKMFIIFCCYLLKYKYSFLFLLLLLYSRTLCLHWPFNAVIGVRVPALPSDYMEIDVWLLLFFFTFQIFIFFVYFRINGYLALARLAGNAMYLRHIYSIYSSIYIFASQCQSDIIVEFINIRKREQFECNMFYMN